MNTNIINDYKQKTSIVQLSKKYNISIYRIKNMLVKNNIKIFSQKEMATKYYVNENYFDNIDSEDKAYFLNKNKMEYIFHKEPLAKLCSNIHPNKAFRENK